MKLVKKCGTSTLVVVNSRQSADIGTTNFFSLLIFPQIFFTSEETLFLAIEEMLIFITEEEIWIFPTSAKIFAFHWRINVDFHYYSKIISDFLQ